MTNKIIQLKNMSGDILLPYAYSAEKDGDGDDIRTKYATVTQVNTKASDTAVVHLAGNETIAGTKTFTAQNVYSSNELTDSRFLQMDMGADTTVAPSELRMRSYRIIDKNGKLLGDFRNTRFTDGKTESNVLARSEISGEEKQSYVNAVVDSDGSIYATCPTPASASDNSNKIATTAWVTSKLSTTNFGYTPNILDFKWSDHVINDDSWLRSDTYSWQSGTVYQTAYQHLVDDFANGTHAQSETISGVTIYYCLSQDGHKIVDTSQLSNVEAMFNATGVAWYFILDTTNQQFKLPRTKFGFTGLRDSVGKYVAESLPNITGELNQASSYSVINDSSTTSGAFYKVSNKNGASVYNSGSAYGLGFDASRSSSIYQNNATVQGRATQMYLYFYVGEYTQSAIEQTAGLNSELFNGKVDLNLSNINPTANTKQAIVEWMLPDWNNKVTITSGYTASTSGWFLFSGDGTNHVTQIVYINGITMYQSSAGNQYQESAINILLPISSGDVITWSSSASYQNHWFIPFKK